MVGPNENHIILKFTSYKQAEPTTIYTFAWLSFTKGHIQEKEIHSGVCDQEAVKQYSPSDTQILQKRNTTWVGIVYIANTSKKLVSFKLAHFVHVSPKNAVKD